MIKKTFLLLIILFFSILTTILLIQFINKYVIKKKPNYFYLNQIQQDKKINNNYLINHHKFNKFPNFIYAVKKSINSIVEIKSYNKIKTIHLDPFSEEFFNFKFYPSKIKKKYIISSGIGSGVILSANGYIITNNHVIDKSLKLKVILHNHKTYTAKIIGKDPNTDIALIKINAINLPFLNFSNSINPKIGEWVIAIGNPFGLKSIVTGGIISAKNKTLNILHSKSHSAIESFIQTDAVINPGNSGGALLDINGNLIGINTAIYAPIGIYMGYGFAIPSHLAQKIVKDIQKFGIVKRGYLGIYTLDLTDNEQIKKYNQLHNKKISPQEGIMIINVLPKSSSQYAGLKKEDIILKINDNKIKSYGDICFAIGDKNPKEIIKIQILRKNKKKNYNILLQNSKQKKTTPNKQKKNIIKILGINLEILTIQQKINFGIQYGLFIKKINQMQFRNLGLEEGGILIKINKKIIYSYRNLNQMLENCKKINHIEYIDPYGRLITTKCNYKIKF